MYLASLDNRDRSLVVHFVELDWGMSAPAKKNIWFPTENLKFLCQMGQCLEQAKIEWKEDYIVMLGLKVTM